MDRSAELPTAEWPNGRAPEFASGSDVAGTAALGDPVDADSDGDGALLAGIRRGQQGALEEAYNRHARPVAWCAASFLPRHLVDDVIQATFLTLWVKAGRITLSGDSLLPWFIGVCRNHSRAALRKEQRHAHQEIPDGADDRCNVEADALRRQLIGAIEEHVATLSPLDAQIYLLCIGEDMTYEGAARRLGVSAPTVRNRLSRLRASLRRQFSEREE